MSILIKIFDFYIIHSFSAWDFIIPSVAPLRFCYIYPMFASKFLIVCNLNGRTSSSIVIVLDGHMSGYKHMESYKKSYKKYNILNNCIILYTRITINLQQKLKKS